METSPYFSVVIPVYKCTTCLLPLLERLQAVFQKMDKSYEVIFVDDCGGDNAWEKISEMSNSFETVRGIHLSRNHGQHLAIAAGVSESSGEWTIVMDCDLQDPPEEIIALYEKAQQGHGIVLAKRIAKKHSLLRRTLSRFYMKLIKVVSHNNVDNAFGCLSIMSRDARQAYNQFKDIGRQHISILCWLDFNMTYIYYDHGSRHSGESSYTLKTLLRHAFHGMLFQSTLFLRWIVYFGFFLVILGFILAIYFISQSFFNTNPVSGWTSMFVLLLLMGGFIISSTGIIGLYISKIFDQVRDRPLFVIDKTVKNTHVQ